MTDLRDARFKKALDEAPDIDARVPLAIAESLRAAARSAAAQTQRATAERVPWWRRMWAGTGQSRGPWGAALATVLLGVLVTTLWIDKPLPEPQPYAPVPEPVAESATIPPVAPVGTSQKTTEELAATSALPNTSSAKPTAPAKPATAPPAAKATAAATPTTTAAATPVPPAVPAPAVKLPATTAAVVAPSPAPREMRTEPEARAVASASIAEAPAAVAAAGMSTDRLEQAPVAVAAAPAPPAAAAAVAPLAAPPVAAAAMAKRAPGPKPDSVDITQQGRSFAADANRAQRLYALVQSLESQAVAGGSEAGVDGASLAPTLALLFRTQSQPLATFTLAKRQARWERIGQGSVRFDLTDAQAAQILQLVQEAKAAEPAR